MSAPPPVECVFTQEVLINLVNGSKLFFFQGHENRPLHLQRQEMVITDKLVRCINCGKRVDEHPPKSESMLTELAEATQRHLVHSQTHSTPSDVRTQINRQCCFACGVTENVSWTRIMKTGKDCEEVQLPSEFVDDLRNFLPLCGTKDQKGSCRNAFDTASLCFGFHTDDSKFHSYFSPDYPFNRIVSEIANGPDRYQPSRIAVHDHGKLVIFRKICITGMESAKRELIKEYLAGVIPPEKREASQEGEVLVQQGEASRHCYIDGCRRKAIRMISRDPDRYLCQPHLESSRNEPEERVAPHLERSRKRQEYEAEGRAKRSRKRGRGS